MTIKPLLSSGHCRALISAAPRASRVVVHLVRAFTPNHRPWFRSSVLVSKASLGFIPNAVCFVSPLVVSSLMYGATLLINGC